MQSLAKRKSRLAFVTEDTVRDNATYRELDEVTGKRTGPVHHVRKDRRVCVEVQLPGYTGEVWLEGTRDRFPFSFAGLYHDAARRAEERARAAKKAARKDRKNADTN